MTDADPDRIATRCGVAAPIVALGSLLLAAIVAPPETFTWRGRALSDMGRYGAETFWLFNGGLIVGGLLGLPFGWRLRRTARHVLERVGVVLLLVAVAGMIGVGVFFVGHTAVYLDTDLHAAAALAFFGVAPFAQWLYGTGRALAGDVRLGLASIWLGIVHPVTWIVWLLYRAAAVDPWTWFAAAEFVAALAFGAWILLLALDPGGRSAAAKSGR